jgi:hypothetical protein
MAAITYGTHGATAEKTISTKPSLLSRIWGAMVEARMRQAMREIRLHSHLLPAEYEIAGNKINNRNEDQLPFVRVRD